MIVLRTTMEAALETERQRHRDDLMRLSRSYGDALLRVEAAHREMQAWITGKSDGVTPEQAAQMFYAQDDRWQAAFFSTMQDQIVAYHAAAGSPHSVGVPAGEGQWYHMAQHLSDSGKETIAAMYYHAKGDEE